MKRMNKYKFILLGEIAGTIVQVQAINHLKASIRIVGWIASNLQELEKMKYSGVVSTKVGKSLIFIKSDLE